MKNIVLVIVLLFSVDAYSQLQAVICDPVKVYTVRGQSNSKSAGGSNNSACPYPINSNNLWIWNYNYERATPIALNDAINFGGKGIGNTGAGFNNVHHQDPSTRAINEWSKTDIWKNYVYKLSVNGSAFKPNANRKDSWNVAVNEIINVDHAQWDLFKADLKNRNEYPIIIENNWNQGESDRGGNKQWAQDLTDYQKAWQVHTGQKNQIWIAYLLTDFADPKGNIRRQQLAWSRLSNLNYHLDPTGVTYKDVLHYDAAGVCFLTQRHINRDFSQ